jgi:hypothetical protein
VSAIQDVRKIGRGKIKVWDVVLTVAAAATTATCTSTNAFIGTVRKIEIDPGAALKVTTTTIKGYEANSTLATGTRDHFLDYTVPSPAVEKAFYPHVAGALNTGAAANPTISVPYKVCDKLTIDVASADAGDSVRVRVWIEED